MYSSTIIINSDIQKPEYHPENFIFNAPMSSLVWIICILSVWNQQQEFQEVRASDSP